MASGQASMVGLSLFADEGLVYSRAPPIREHYAFFGNRHGEAFIFLLYAPDLETEGTEQLPFC